MNPLKHRHSFLGVIPAEAVITSYQAVIDSRLRENDIAGDCIRGRQGLEPTGLFQPEYLEK